MRGDAGGAMQSDAGGFMLAIGKPHSKAPDTLNSR
jgi:hypothetical protein